MEVPKMLKKSEVFRVVRKHKPTPDFDRHDYVIELATACSVKILDPKTEIGEIPFGLGKSEKFSNKFQIFSALRALKFIDEKSIESWNVSKRLEKSYSKNSKSPVPAENTLNKTFLGKFSPGSVRIKSEEKSGFRYCDKIIASPGKLRKSFLPAPHKYSTPQSKSPLPQKRSVSPLKSYNSMSKSPIKSYALDSITTFTSQISNKIPSINSSPQKFPVPDIFITAKSTINPFPLEKISTPAELKYMKTYEDIADYKGGIHNGQKDGYGEVLYKNGDWYKGSWKKNLKDGPGEFYSYDFKVKFKGEFKKNLACGPGVLAFDSGDTFKANWTGGFIENGLAYIQYKDGSKYDGEIKDAKRSGYGKIQYSNGGVYQGFWTNDQRSGHGVLLCRGDLFYEGIFAGDFTDGPGVLVRRDIYSLEPVEKRPRTSSAIYQNNGGCIDKSAFFIDMNSFPQFKALPIEFNDLVWMTLTTQNAVLYTGRALTQGKFFAGRLSGAGIAKYGFFGIYYGNFIDGKRSGFGRMKYSDPDHQCLWFPETEGEYTGEWKEDKRHGVGKMQWANGTIYEGAFNYDRRHNVKGKITFTNGDIYEGGWVDDRMEGGCTLTRRGIIIKGQFASGLLSSFARVEYPDGRVYEGDISNNFPQGNGVMKWPNNNLYQGGFLDGNMDGVGKMVYSNGDIYEGHWENGARQGRGIMVYLADKLIYEGEWVDGKRSGEGCLKTLKGEIIKSCFWNNDESMY